jgi:hypothetical protein
VKPSRKASCAPSKVVPSVEKSVEVVFPTTATQPFDRTATPQPTFDPSPPIRTPGVDRDAVAATGRGVEAEVVVDDRGADGPVGQHPEGEVGVSSREDGTGENDIPRTVRGNAVEGVRVGSPPVPRAAQERAGLTE